MATSSDASNESLSSLFRTTMKQVLSMSSLQLDVGSYEYQTIVKNSISQLERSTELINNLQLFSSNERLEDIQTAHLKYLLTPAFLGNLTSKLKSDDRLQIVILAIVYYSDFCQRLYDYKLILEQPPICNKNEDEDGKQSRKAFPQSQPSLEDIAKERAEKINRYRESVQLDSDLEQMAYVLNQEKEDTLDDEVVRNYYLKLIRRWNNIARDDLKMLEMEKEMLTMMKGKSLDDMPSASKSKTAFKPFIITKNELQKKVFGLGYPSRPTVTIEEFVNTKIEEGTLNVAQGHSLEKWAKDPEGKDLSDEQDQADKEKLEENEDQVHLIRERNWDEWKDEHKRGWGNRHNMG